MYRFGFYGSESRDYEKMIFSEMTKLNLFHITHLSAASFDSPQFDGAIVYGLQRHRKKVMSSYLAQGKPVIFFDKAYMSTKQFGGRNSGVRVAINSTQPTLYFNKLFPDYNRLHRYMDIESFITPKKIGKRVLICGSSERYQDFYDLPPSWEHMNDLTRQVRELTDLPIIVRFKPKLVLPGELDVRIPKVSLDVEGSIRISLARSRVLITHGSGASVNAVQSGVPVIVLGDHPSSHIGSSKLSIKRLAYPRLSGRVEWFARLFQCQWGFKELGEEDFKQHLIKTLTLSGYTL